MTITGSAAPVATKKRYGITRNHGRRSKIVKMLHNTKPPKRKIIRPASEKMHASRIAYTVSSKEFIMVSTSRRTNASARSVPPLVRLYSLSVCVAPIIHGHDRDNLLLRVYDEEDPVFPDSVAPCVWGVASQFFDVDPEIRFSPQLGVNILGEFVTNEPGDLWRQRRKPIP